MRPGRTPALARFFVQDDFLIILHVARSSHVPRPCFAPLSILNIGRSIIIVSLRELLFFLSFPGTFLSLLNEGKQNEYIGGEISRRVSSFTTHREWWYGWYFFFSTYTYSSKNCNQNCLWRISRCF